MGFAALGPRPFQLRENSYLIVFVFRMSKALSHEASRSAVDSLACAYFGVFRHLSFLYAARPAFVA